MVSSRLGSHLGYKVAILRNGKLYSVYEPTFEISEAKIWELINVNRFYLGTSKKFALDYYSGLTDEKEVLLTYWYMNRDIVSGGPPNHSLAEIIVSRARLVDIELIGE